MWNINSQHQKWHVRAKKVVKKVKHLKTKETRLYLGNSWNFGKCSFLLFKCKTFCRSSKTAKTYMWHQKKHIGCQRTEFIRRFSADDNLTRVKSRKHCIFSTTSQFYSKLRGTTLKTRNRVLKNWSKMSWRFPLWFQKCYKAE